MPGWNSFPPLATLTAAFFRAVMPPLLSGWINSSVLEATQNTSTPFANAQASKDSQNPAGPAGPATTRTGVNYAESFQDLHQVLGRDYPCFELKSIDWKKVGQELLPRSLDIKTDAEFGLLCMELVARLQDSHAYLLDGSCKVPEPPVARWDPGFACLRDDQDQFVVYYVDRGGPADQAGIKPGTVVLAIDGTPAEAAFREVKRQISRYQGYSSERYLGYQAAQWLARRTEKGDEVLLETRLRDGTTNTCRLPASLGIRYLPRLPVPIRGIRDSADVSWRRLPSGVGYLYVRRIAKDLVASLDQAIADLKDARGLVLDVRGNSGGGFDGNSAFRNFALDDAEGSPRRRYLGKMALLIDPRCISAGEGWASWFMAQKRARVFGEATAGASSRKNIYTLKNGLFRVQFSVKAYTGFLDRPIEFRGLEPDVHVRPSAADLAEGRDTVLETAVKYLTGEDR